MLCFFILENKPPEVTGRFWFQLIIVPGFFGNTMISLLPVTTISIYCLKLCTFKIKSCIPWVSYGHKLQLRIILHTNNKKNVEKVTF